jgi:hypothetical protein
LKYDVTVRHGSGRKHYHTFTVEAPDVSEALRLAAARIPGEVTAGADLVELRAAVDPDGRSYLEEETES